MTLGQPGIGTKDGPAQEKVDAAIKRKQATVLSMAEWWAMCSNAGAVFAGIEEVRDGTMIALKGFRNGSPIESHAVSPTGQPLQLTATMVLEHFRNVKPGEAIHVIPTHARETEPPPPHLPPDVPPITAPGFAPDEEMGGSDYAAQPTLLTDREREETSGAYSPDAINQARAAAGLPATSGGGIGTSKTSVSPDAPIRFKTHTSMIKKQDGTPIHRHQAGKLPPGAAGMCDHCKEQPTQHHGSRFCGARCAQAFHTAILKARLNVNVPRVK